MSNRMKNLNWKVHNSENKQKIIWQKQSSILHRRTYKKREVDGANFSNTPSSSYRHIIYTKLYKTLISVSSKPSSRDIYAVGGRTFALQSNHEKIKRGFKKQKQKTLFFLVSLGCSGPLDARTFPEWLKNNLKKIEKN